MNEMNAITERKNDLTSGGGILGLEDIQKGELIIPRCKLTQPTSPELVQNPNLRPGQFVNSITLAEVQPGFIPILKRSKWIRFNARKKDDPGYDDRFEPGAMIWQSDNPDSDLVKAEGVWGDDNTPPLATKFMNVFCLFDGETMPLVLSFSRTSFKAGRQLLTMARFSGESALFSRRYSVAAKPEHDPNSGGNYFTIIVRQEGKTGEKEFQTCMDIYKTLGQQNAKIHDEGREDNEEEEAFA